MIGNKDIYSITLLEDRYTGAYSGALWLAFNCEQQNIPEEVRSDDTDCRNFWDREENHFKIGKGNTPEAAFQDLVSKMTEED